MSDNLRGIEMPDPAFPHSTRNHFPLPGLMKLDTLCLPPNAEPLEFMLAIMRENRCPCGDGSRHQGGSTIPPHQN